MEKYKKSYIISSFEVDLEQRLRLRSLFNLFQDLADEHAEKIGVGYTFCAQNGIGWVGGAYHVRIDRLPTWGDEIMIETWPSGTTAACGIRDFRVTDRVGHVLAVATSQWVLIDTTRLRPIPVAKHLPQYELLGEHALASDFGKIEAPEGPATERVFPVRMDDIDLNGHVNNALYPTWALDGVEPSFYMTHTPAEVRVSFRRSARIKDMIRMMTYVNGDRTTSVMTDTTGKTEFARVELLWQKRK